MASLISSLRKLNFKLIWKMFSNHRNEENQSVYRNTFLVGKLLRDSASCLKDRNIEFTLKIVTTLGSDSPTALPTARISSHLPPVKLWFRISQFSGHSDILSPDKPLVNEAHAFSYSSSWYLVMPWKAYEIE